MTEDDIKLLLLIHLTSPRNPGQIPTYQTSNLRSKGLAYWMPTDRDRHALALTRKGTQVASQIVWEALENFDC